MLKRKVSCTFKRKNTLDNQERIYLLFAISVGRLITMSTWVRGPSKVTRLDSTGAKQPLTGHFRTQLGRSQ